MFSPRVDFRVAARSGRPHAIDDATRTWKRKRPFRSEKTYSRLPLLRARARVGPKKQFGAEMDVMQHFARATNDGHPSAIILRKRYDTAARALHAARASAHLPRLPFGCPPTFAWSAAALGAAHWYGQTAPWPCTGHAEHASRRGLRARAGWLVIGSKPERVGAPRQQVETQRYWSSGRHDITGCLRPCLIAYYDFCFRR